MYNIRQFQPVLYIVLFIGISGFSLAAESGPLFLVGVVAMGSNAWLMARGWFKPMPRVVSNLVTIAALVYVIHEVLTSGIAPVLMIGEFLMLLQMVKLWEQRGNRDHAQLLILSLLLMVAAAISTNSIIFAALMVIYLFLALYCCLLFHLKTETDAAKAAISIPARQLSLATLRQDQRYLSRSMRKLTMSVSTVGIIFAVAVFILFPRGPGAGMIGPVQFKPTQALVGFSEEMSFQQVRQLVQDDSIVAYVKLTHNGEPVQGNVPLLLRGVTRDSYTGKAGRASWEWKRWPDDLLLSRLESANKGSIDVGQTLKMSDGPDPADKWVQSIKLLPTGTDVLFAMPGAYSIKPIKLANFVRPDRFDYRLFPRDGQIDLTSPRDSNRPRLEVEYEVTSSNDLGNTPPPAISGTAPERIDPAITSFAKLPAVSGSDANGPLAEQRAKHEHSPVDPYVADPLDGQIAANMERYLRTNFSYTLDLTGVEQVKGRDPMVAFLYDYKKGHCEYFAASMTLMCQSLGMKARICRGFRCDEYNGTPGAGYYIVRGLHAHSWVEVYTANGWRSYDPTSELDSIAQAQRDGAWQKLKHVFNFLQYTYGNAIIAFSNEDRSNLIQNTESAMINAAAKSSVQMDRLRHFRMESLWGSSKFMSAFSGMLRFAMIVMAGGVVFVIIRYLQEKVRLRKRAARIGLESLPADEQMRLARQLAFYDNLLLLLIRHKLVRQPNQTPLEFSKSLLFLPANAYESIRRLTEMFYKVRYGKTDLTPGRQERLGTVVTKLEVELGRPGK